MDVAYNETKYNFGGLGGSLGQCGLSEIYLVTKQV